MIQHLKDRAYYENIYDHGTIRELKGLESIGKKAKKEGTPDVSELLILFTKMDRYEHREEWIQKIMEKDRRRDEFQNNTKPCSDIVRCKLCNERIEYHYKNFDENYETGKFRMLFLYRCDSCKQGRGIYSTGEEFVGPKEKCKNCGKVADYNGKFEGDTLVKTISCESCNETYIEEEDFTTTKIKEDPITQKDIDKYGYTSKQAQEMGDMKRSMNEMSELLKDMKERKKDDIYKEGLEKLKKLNMFQLDELVNKSLEKTDFANFKITNKGQEKTYMRCEFEVYYKGEFGEKASRKFDKLLNNVLNNSNWRIQKNKTDEKLGLLQGVVYGYDQEKDLIELIKKREK